MSKGLAVIHDKPLMWLWWLWWLWWRLLFASDGLLGVRRSRELVSRQLQTRPGS